MNSKVFYVLLLLAFCVFTPSCRETEVIEEAQIFFENEGQEVFNLEPESCTMSLCFSANYNWWISLSTEGDWIHVSPDTGGQGDAEVQLTVDENEGELRTAILTVTCKDIQKSVKIIQAQARPYLLIDVNQAEFSYEGGSVKVTVSTNTDFEIINDNDWIACEKGSADGEYLISVLSNEEYTERNGVLTFVANDGLSAELNVFQDAKPRQIIQFGCPQLKQYCVEHYDKNGDGEIDLEEEAAEVTVITPSSGVSFASLAGIEYFSNLEKIVFSDGSQINTVDFTNNKKLTEIGLPATNITSIDLTPHGELSVFAIGACFISGLDLSSNTQLSSLSIQGCQNLKTLDLSENKALTSISITNCSLTDLDVSGCVSLQKLCLSPMSSGNDLDYLVVSSPAQLEQIGEKDVATETHVLVAGCLELSESEIEIGYVGSEFQITTFSTEDCNVSDMPSWISLDNSEQKDKYQKVYDFSASLNPDYTSRAGDIMFSGENGVIKNKVSLTQGQKPETYVEFTSEEVKSYCLANYDPNGDGKISVEREADYITSIQLNDISGEAALCDIKLIKNLEKLNITGGNISEIDLSQNTMLAELSLINNYKAASINLSNNVKLKSLCVQGSDLESIDLSRLGDLEELKLTNSNLSELDLSGNPELITLHCYGNDLTRLDVSSNKKLENLEVSPMNNGNELDYLIVSEGAVFDVTDQTIVVERDVYRPLDDCIEIPFEGGKFEVCVRTTNLCTVSSNVDWVVSKGWDNKVEGQYLYKQYFNAGKNEVEEERTCVLIIKDNLYNTVGTVTVRQAAYQKTEVGSGNEDIVVGEDFIM